MQQSVPVPVPPAVDATRWLAFASALGLVLLGLAWELWLAPLRAGGTVWVLKVLPIALALPGLYLRRMYTYRWTSLLVWLYFIEGVVRATGKGIGDSLPLALSETFLAILLFIACVLHVRVRQRNSRHD